jgi:hypothetical protein
MPSQNDDSELKTLIFRDFELEIPEKELDEAALRAYLADAIAYMIEHKLDFLLSLLYRLDVAEEKINAALMPGNNLPANEALADLVWARQQQRIATKNTYGPKNKNDTSKWNWSDDDDD